MFGFVRREDYEQEQRARLHREAEVGELRARLAVLEEERAWPVVPLDGCLCGDNPGDAWYRMGTLVAVQHDGTRDHVSAAGSRLLCLACGEQYHHGPKGLTKPKVHMKPPETGGKPPEPPAHASGLRVRTPGVR
jgi:hypothetical protein